MIKHAKNDDDNDSAMAGNSFSIPTINSSKITLDHFKLVFNLAASGLLNGHSAHCQCCCVVVAGEKSRRGPLVDHVISARIRPTAL